MFRTHVVGQGFAVLYRPIGDALCVQPRQSPGSALDTDYALLLAYMNLSNVCLENGWFRRDSRM